MLLIKDGRNATKPYILIYRDGYNKTNLLFKYTAMKNLLSLFKPYSQRYIILEKLLKAWMWKKVHRQKLFKWIEQYGPRMCELRKQLVKHWYFVYQEWEARDKDTYYRIDVLDTKKLRREYVSTRQLQTNLFTAA